jgi:hypothetical protein
MGWRRSLLLEIATSTKNSCGISRRSTPVKYRITESTVDAELFAMEMEDAVASGFLRPGDVLVMDNAANHTGKENTVLEDWLWNDHSIFALFLPARTPEWNPIELLWNCLSMRLKHNDWDNIHGSSRVATRRSIFSIELHTGR